jgi:F0F1-type ATP synthase membrane subunit a
MEYTLTVNVFYVLWTLALVLVFYIYTKDDGDDRLTQMRNDLEARKEWFRMLAEQNKRKKSVK